MRLFDKTLGAVAVCLVTAGSGLAGCAYGTGSDGFGLERSRLESDASVEPDVPYSSGDSGMMQDVVHHEDTGTTFEPDTSAPFDSGRSVFDTGTSCPLSLPTGIPACDSCVSANCCTEDNACGEDPQCLNFDECLSTCISPDGGAPDGGFAPDGGPAACEAACEASNPTGASELTAIESCMQTSCAAACGI